MAEFEFKTQSHLIRLLGLRAFSISQMADVLENVELSSIYYHTHRFLKQHQFLSPEPPNDFAYWIKNTMNIKDLSENIASIDTIRYASLRELRAEIVARLREYIDKNGQMHNCRKNEEFNFMSCKTYVVPLERKAGNLKEFYENIKIIDVSSIYFHMFESKLRMKSDKSDFSSWLEELGELELAQKISRLDPYNMTMEALRKKILALIEKRL